MELRFDGKVALITGGARGIGYAAAELLAEGGAKVALVDVNGERAEESARKPSQRSGLEAIGVRTDVSREQDVSAMAEEVARRLGPADIFDRARQIGRAGSRKKRRDAQYRVTRARRTPSCGRSARTACAPRWAKRSISAA